MKLRMLKKKMNLVVMLKVILILCCALPFPAQGTTAAAPSLRVKGEAGLQPISLAKLDVVVKISGIIAETKMTMTFYNPNDRELEGEFLFPLPQGATVSGYALDMNGVMVDGVAVEKQRGREVFEEIVRQGIDPGLMEMVQGNTFMTRIYPILSNNSRTISVRYLSELNCRDKKVFFRLPLDFKEPIKDFSIRLEVIKAGAKPVIREGTAAGLEFSRDQGNYIACASSRNTLLDKDLVIELPGAAKRKVFVEKAADGCYYFYIYDINPIYNETKQKLLRGVQGGAFLEKRPPGRRRQETKTPTHITILWDASGSRNESNHEKELQLLEAYFKKDRVNPDDNWHRSFFPGRDKKDANVYSKLFQGTKKKDRRKKIKVDLVLFRHRRFAPRRFVVKRGDCRELIRAIKNVAYDGATRMEALSPLKRDRTPDFYMLFSDGMANFGSEEPSGFKAPVYIFSASSSANHPYLEQLAMQTGGSYFNLNYVDEASVIEAVGRSPFCFLSANANKKVIGETFPRMAKPLQGSFILTGKLLARQGKITLNYGIKGKTLKKVYFNLDRDDAAAGNLLRTFWAQKKIEELRIFAKNKKNKAELIATGRKYGLVTPYTSLIVLESLEQYIAYEIKPPETLPQMRKHYEEAMAEREEERAEEQSNKIDDVLSLWAERVEWWNKEFKLPEKPKKKKKTKIQAVLRKPAQESQETTAVQDKHAETGQTEVKEIVKAEAKRTVVSGVPPGSESIYGKVVLLDGSVIPGVAVFLTGETLMGRKTAVTQENGSFRFPALPPGKYTLRFELDGFKTAVQDDVGISPGKEVELEVPMEVTDIKEEVVVCGKTGAVDCRKTVAAGKIIIDTDSITPEKTDSSAKIELKPWNPAAPYMKEIAAAGPKKAFPEYLAQKKVHGSTPGFFLDCSNYFFKQKQRDLGLQVLSNIAEIKLENAAFLKILGSRLTQLGFLELSAAVFEKVLELRPEEPQSYRDLALVLARLGQYKRAIELLYHVVTNFWDFRFEAIEVIALMEINHIIARAEREGHSIKKIAAVVDPRLVKLLDVDIRIVLTWDEDLTDIDLWVIEPSGEKADYSNDLTRIGGLVSEDFTEGFGPEEYLLKKAMRGKYKIMADYFGTETPRIIGPVTLQVDIFTNFGRKNEQYKSITLRLKDETEDITVAEIEF